MRGACACAGGGEERSSPPGAKAGYRAGTGRALRLDTQCQRLASLTYRSSQPAVRTHCTASARWLLPLLRMLHCLLPSRDAVMCAIAEREQVLAWAGQPSCTRWVAAPSWLDLPSWRGHFWSPMLTVGAGLARVGPSLRWPRPGLSLEGHRPRPGAVVVWFSVPPGLLNLHSYSSVNYPAQVLEVLGFAAQARFGSV